MPSLANRLKLVIAGAVLVPVLAPAAQWVELGPSGGDITSVASGSPGVVHALVTAVDLRVYRSTDSGRHWTRQARPETCNWPYSSSLQVRSDGDVFLHCGGPIFRSPRGVQPWTAFSPGTFDGTLLLDPSAVSRAVLLTAYTFGGVFNIMTPDDGINWTPPANVGVPIPRLMRFDPPRAGRLIGVGTETAPNRYSTRFYESFDYGAHWAGLSNVLPAHGDNASACYYERSFAVDNSGRLFVNHDCGFYRSLDGGATWQVMAGYPGERDSPIVVDAANGDRLLVIGLTTIHESRDAGTSWHAFPLPPAVTTQVDVSTSGELSIATQNGVYLYDATTGTWLSRNAGLNAHPVIRVEPALGNALVLSAIGRAGLPSVGGGSGNVQSLDGGRTWLPFAIAGKAAAQTARNLLLPNSVLALTSQSEHQLFGSDDGGITWQLISSNPSPAPGQFVTQLVPIGPQPGLVYGLLDVCVPSGFGGCFWTPRGVTKSLDGGGTWAITSQGLPAGTVRNLWVAPSDAQVAFVSVSDGAYVTRDGAASWQKISPTVGARFTPHPAQASRWYGMGLPGGLAVTTDYGSHWTPLSEPDTAGEPFDLLVDPQAPDSLYAVGTNGVVTISTDGGAHWQRVVQPSTSLTIPLGTVRLSPASPPTLYAPTSSGVVSLAIAADFAAIGVPALDPVMLFAMALSLLVLATWASRSTVSKAR